MVVLQLSLLLGAHHSHPSRDAGSCVGHFCRLREASMLEANQLKVWVWLKKLALPLTSALQLRSLASSHSAFGPRLRANWPLCRFPYVAAPAA